ncbi:MAG: cytochrome c biogenesis protein CcsA [Candidatus Hodarchaeales archaeon]|jgi:cytochrome c biogenesis factor
MINILGMDLGFLLLLISLVAFILDFIIVIMDEFIEKWKVYSELNLVIGCSAFIMSFFYFSYSVISADYNFINVSAYVSNDMDFFLRLSAIWSGQAGSFFFWTFLILLLYFVFRVIFRNYAHETTFYRSFVLLVVQVAIMIVLTIMSEPFKLNTVKITDGLGLNPLLMNGWNIVHPPVIFIGYALCSIPMVIGIVRISIIKDGQVPNFDGKEKLDYFFEFMVSLAWLGLSSGIIIGGYWAYITLGWGGFWAWDPIETASLIPWLFITLYYHGKTFFRKKEYFSNYIVSMSYIGALFVTYLTRSGIISSVHAFRPEGTLEQILILFIPENSFIMSIILRVIPDQRMLFLFIVILAMFLLPLFLGIRNKEIKQIKTIFFERKDFQASRSQRTALKISFIALLVGTYWMIFGLIFPVIYDVIGYIITFHPNGFGQGISIPLLEISIPPNLPTDESFYNSSLAIFGGVMLLAQFFCTFYPRLNVKQRFGILGGGVTAGILFAGSGFFYRLGSLTSIMGHENPILSIFSNFWTTSDKANLVIPLLLLGMIGLIAEFIIVAVKEEKNLIRKTSQILLHLSFLVIILGALMSANMTITSRVIVSDNQEKPIPETSLTIRIIELDKPTIPESELHDVEYDTVFNLSTDTRIIGYGTSRLYFDKQRRVGYDVTIFSDFLSDIHIVTVDVNDTSIGFEASTLQIKIVPYINILWIGCLFLHFAIIPLTIKRFLLLKESFLSSEKENDNDKNKKYSDNSEAEVNSNGE